jgi:hypothetical protein
MVTISLTVMETLPLGEDADLPHASSERNALSHARATNPSARHLLSVCLPSGRGRRSGNVGAVTNPSVIAVSNPNLATREGRQGVSTSPHEWLHACPACSLTVSAVSQLSRITSPSRWISEAVLSRNS